MAIIEIHPEPIVGPWVEGFVLDKHMIASVPVGQAGDRTIFDSTRTAMGELLFRLKNRSGPADDIIDTAAAFAAGRWPGRIDCVVWPPPSADRRRQPAALLAAGIAGRLGLAVLDGAVRKVTVTAQMKNIPTYERAAILDQAIQPGSVPVAGRRVLIVDDLWQTGGTMRRVAAVVNSMGATEVRALAMTRTR
jgi:predicted amidophosphoribosyltransferase